MKREVKELKRIARGNLQGNYLVLIRAFVFCNIIVSLIEMPFSLMTNEIFLSTQNIIYYIAFALITIGSVVLTVGQYCLHLRLARTGKIHLVELFYPLQYDANRLIFAEIALWGIRLIGLAPIIGAIVLFRHFDTTSMYLLALGLGIVGCILTLFIEVTFGMTYFVLIDGEELSIMEALKATTKLIKRNKGRFLYLLFSFTGMYLLVLLTLGCGLLWVQPYVMQTTTLFYLDTKDELSEVLEKRRKTEPTPAPVSFDSYA